MASEKQARMLYARALEAGIKPDYNAYLALENGQVDAELAKIAKCKANAAVTPSKKKAQAKTEYVNMRNSDAFDKATTIPQTKPEYSDIRAGLAMKLLIQHSSIIRCLNEPENFIDTAERLYFLLARVENALKRDCQQTKEPLA